MIKYQFSFRVGSQMPRWTEEALSHLTGLSRDTSYPHLLEAKGHFRDAVFPPEALDSPSLRRGAPVGEADTQSEMLWPQPGNKPHTVHFSHQVVYFLSRGSASGSTWD